MMSLLTTNGQIYIHSFVENHNFELSKVTSNKTGSLIGILLHNFKM